MPQDRPTKFQFLADWQQAIDDWYASMLSAQRGAAERMHAEFKASGLALDDLVEIIRAEGTEAGRRAEALMRAIVAAYQNATDD